jgi:hypothetical protein
MEEDSNAILITTHIMAGSKMVKLMGKVYTLGTTEKSMMVNGTKA